MSATTRSLCIPAAAIRTPDLSYSIIRSFAFLVSVQELRRLHCLLLISGLSASPFFSGKLISKYSAFGDATAARSVFATAPHSKSNVFLWNSIIRAYAHNGMFSKALDLYRQMQGTRLHADVFTFPSVLSACAGLRDVEMGATVHNHIREAGLCSDLYIGNSLINMYARLGCLLEAQLLFDRMPRRDLVSWNSLISGYTANGEWLKGAEVYGQLRRSGLIPDCFTVESILPAYGFLGYVDHGRVLHSLVNKVGIDHDRLVNNGLISMYCRFQEIVDAQRVFSTMADRDTVSWNTMMDGYFQSSLFIHTLELFRALMLKASDPDLVSFTVVLRSSSYMDDMKYGRSIHGYMLRNGHECDVTASNILIAFYSKFGRLKASYAVFSGMPSRDLVSWNLLLNGYTHNGCFEEVKVIFRLMNKSDIKPDSVTLIALLTMCTQLVDSTHGMLVHCYTIRMGYNKNIIVGNSILDMYSKFGTLNDALKQFQEMETHDVVSFNTIISGCVLNANCNLGLEIFGRMKAEGIEPDTATMLGVLPACSFLASKRLGKSVHSCIFRLALESDLAVGNALIDMHSKCGNLDYSICVFNHMKVKDVVTWTTLVSAFGMYGKGKLALGAFSDMEGSGIKPDSITFVAFLYACSHSGLVEDGLTVFNRMEKDYGITPNIEHYACVVDLLSRSGKLLEAENFILSMPIEPDTSIWGALLSSCRSNEASAVTEYAAKKIVEFGGDNPGYYVLASNVYASTGKWNVVSRIRNSIKARGRRKDPAYSWIEIGNKMYAFSSGFSFEQSKEVFKLLDELAILMVKEGHAPDMKFVLHDVEEDDKRHVLCGHSERLAIAFGLLNTKPGTPLQVMKNLRVCGDCHTVIKYISKIVKREFLVRDANRFHLFKDGTCSCGDYW